MTSIALTASICASASEAARLVAVFMLVSLDLSRSRFGPLGLLLGMTHRGAGRASDGQILYSEHPSTRFACSSPHSANIDRLKVEQYYGGNLARVQPDCAGEKELFARGNCSVDPPPGAGHDPAHQKSENQGEKWPASTTAIPSNTMTAPGSCWARTATPTSSR